jgi:hypothetical protein
MEESSIDRFIVPVPESRDVMTEILRAGAQKMLAEAIHQEVEGWIAQRASLRDEQGRRQVILHCPHAGSPTPVDGVVMWRFT